MILRIVLLSGALVLAGCTSEQPVQQEVIVSGASFDNVRGEASTVVRSYIEDPSGQRREVIGADCDVTTSLYKASLTTPARLLLPNFGPQSPDLIVACTAGDMSGSGQVRISTNWRYPPGAYGYPAVGLYGGTGGGAGIALGWNGWGYATPAYPVSGYPDVSIELR